MKRIPYGISNFKTLVEENYYYVDKTKYIEKLENLNTKYLILLRPRRFGKSLFISTLEYYYDIRYKDEKLFDNFYIGKNPTKMKNSYYVLSFNFSGINTSSKDGTVSGFNNNVANGIERFLSRYEIDVNIDREKSAAEMLDDFFNKIEKLINGKVYILIDEYDHFANELLSFEYEFFSKSVSENGFVRKFYEVIKNGTQDGIVDRLFMTGVNSITLDSMTSGFNIIENLTIKPEFNETMGFTKDEVLKLADETIKDKMDIRENLEKLREYYDSYKFHIDGKEHIYNSDMVLYYMNSIQQYGKEPEDMIDRNVVSDYGKIGRLFEVGGFDNERIEILKQIVKGEDIEVKIVEKFTLGNKFGRDDFKSLLFYMGFLTIKRIDEFGSLYLGIPNYVIKELYYEYFEKLIEEHTKYNIDNSDIREAIKELAKDGKIDKLVKLVEDTLHRLSNRDFIKFDEKYVKVILLGFLFKSNIYFAKSEYEIEDGYIDIALLKGTIGKPRYYGIFELKYISKSDYNKHGEELVKEKMGEAKEQLAKYEKSEDLKKLPNLKKFALVFVGEKCRVEEIIK